MRQPPHRPLTFAPHARHTPLALAALAPFVPLALALALGGGCGDDGDGDGDATPTSLTYTGHILDALDSAPLAGVAVCITRPSGIPCVTTDATGAYTIEGLPPETRVTATVTKDAYFPVHAAFITRDRDFTIDAVLLKTALVQVAFSAAGISFDIGKGAILVRAYDPDVGYTSAVEGIVGEITPDAGDGPIYNDADAIPSDATATSTSGTWAIVNLAAGTYQVRSTGPGRDCPGTFHWPGTSGAGWIETPVLAGHVTYVYVDCPTTD